MIINYKLEEYINGYLSSNTIKDYAPNGIQIEGRREIKQICTAVTASYDVIVDAINQNADALLVHHGYFWKGESQIITGIKKKRIAKLLSNDINLYSYHLPIDCHTVIGNNAAIAKLFNVQSVKSHRCGEVDNLLWTGKLKNPLTVEQLTQFIEQKLFRKPLLINGNNKKITNIAWCSGAAQDFITEAAFLGADAYISGEVSERTYYLAKELGINYFAAGHHATERYGIQQLGEHLCDKFFLKHIFIDTDNPV